MRKCFLFVILLCLPFLSYSQEDVGTLLGPDTKIGAFGGPMMDFTTVGNDFGFMMGGGGALIFNRKFYFGGFGTGLTTGVQRVVDAEEMNLDMGYGGFMLGYLFRPNDAIHFGLSSRLGFGSAELRSLNTVPFSQQRTIRNSIFAAIPQAEIELNLTKFMRLNIGAGYRMVTGLSKPEFGNSDALDGLNFNLTVKFGGSE